MDFVDAVYDATESFPQREIFGLANQLRRAAVSIPSNIAEGSAKRSTPDFIRYINISSGSAAEIETQLIIAERRKLITKEQGKMLINEVLEIGRMLYGLQKSLKEKV